MTVDGYRPDNAADAAAVAHPDPTRARLARTHAKSILTAVTHSARTPREERRVAPIWEQHPASLSDLVTRVREGWVIPGEAPEWLEQAGRVYGYGLMLPMTCVGYAFAWVWQGRLRPVVAALVVAAVWFVV